MNGDYYLNNILKPIVRQWIRDIPTKGHFVLEEDRDSSYRTTEKSQAYQWKQERNLDYYLTTIPQ